MRKFLDGLLAVLLFLWQLPQNIVGACMLVHLWDKVISISKYIGATVVYCPDLAGRYNVGCSLGGMIFTSETPQTETGARIVAHEYGHCRQSVVLGPLYLPVVGIFSGLHAAFWRPGKGDYYAFWTEKWADRWGGVKR